jgi:hypothetical protein
MPVTVALAIAVIIYAAVGSGQLYLFSFIVSYGPRMESDLQRLKTLAQRAMDARHNASATLAQDLERFAQAATPEAVLALIARVERGEPDALARVVETPDPNGEIGDIQSAPR